MRQELIRTEPADLIDFGALIGCQRRQQETSETIAAIRLIGPDGFMTPTADQRFSS